MSPTSAQSRFYTLAAPLEWASPPQTFSFSSLQMIKTCPRQWQLLNSKYEGYKRYPRRPNPAAVVGSIVHEMVEVLFRRLGRAGFPPIGSPNFVTIIRELDLRSLALDRIDAYRDKTAEHPRRHNVVAGLNPQRIVAKVTHLFRQQYRCVRPSSNVSVPTGTGVSNSTSTRDIKRLLNNIGVLAELKLCHPEMPLVGVVDLIRSEPNGPALIDFKTGSAKESHRDQLHVYALIWWRNVGELPTRLELCTSAGTETVAFDEPELIALEARMREQIQNLTAELGRPGAGVRLGDHCKHCDVRQLCDEYWEQAGDHISPEEWQDVSVSVDGEPTATGFRGTLSDGRSTTVTYSEDIWLICGPFVADQKLRLLGAQHDARGGEFRIVRTTEVFVNVQ